VKVLLVVRDAGAFTRSVQGRLRGAVEANWPVTRLSAIGEASDRPRWFANAVKAYARATGRAAPPGLETNRTKVGGPDEAMILTQVRAALTVLAKNPAEAAGYRTAPVDDLVAALVGHEQVRPLPRRRAGARSAGPARAAGRTPTSTSSLAARRDR